ncbi:MAG: hypothetical protein ACE5LX_03805 [Nitrospinota bacterium]
MREIKVRCHFCGKGFIWEGEVHRKSLCPHCSSDLHCCRNCRFYDENAHNQCLEPAAEWVRDKALANFCEYLELREALGEGTSVDKAAEARTQFQALFKKRN